MTAEKAMKDALPHKSHPNPEPGGLYNYGKIYTKKRVIPKDFLQKFFRVLYTWGADIPGMISILEDIRQNTVFLGVCRFGWAPEGEGWDLTYNDYGERISANSVIAYFKWPGRRSWIGLCFQTSSEGEVRFEIGYSRCDMPYGLAWKTWKAGIGEFNIVGQEPDYSEPYELYQPFQRDAMGEKSDNLFKALDPDLVKEAVAWIKADK